MSDTNREVVKVLELLKMKCTELKTSLKLFSDRLDKLDMDTRISFNYIPAPHRNQALNLISESSAKLRTWSAELDFVISRLDSSARELNIQQSMEKEKL